MKELSSLLLATEVAITLVTTAYFGGFSIGYLVAHRLTDRMLRTLAVSTFLLHLFLPFLPRTLVGLLYSWELRAFVPFVLAAIAVFGGTAFYSIFLPRFIERRNTPTSFRVYMTFELLGMIMGLIATMIISTQSLALLLTIYITVLLAILHIVLGWRLETVAFAPIVLLFALSFNQIESLSTAYAYRKIYNFNELQTVESTQSLYQRIAVVQAKSGNRYLYLDGFQHYGSNDLSKFNDYIGGLPSSLNPMGSVLVVGSGSSFAVDKIAATAAKVTSVEIDAAVPEIGQRTLRRGRQPAEKLGWSLIIDDAKHFLGTTDERFDVIAMDIAGPFQFQTALLYTREFYETAKRALTPRGIVAVQLSGRFAEPGPNAKRIAATLKSAFNVVYVVDPESTDTAFAIAGDNPTFDQGKIAAWLEARGEKARVFNTDQVRLAVRATPPLSKGSMDVVIAEGLKRFGRRFFRARDPQ